MSEALDFSRYAPQRPTLVWSNDGKQQADDLQLALQALALCIRIVPLASRVVLAILLKRARARFDRLMQSLTVSWTLAGTGWGVSLGLAATLFLVR